MKPRIYFIHGRGRQSEPTRWREVLRQTVRSAGFTPPALEGGGFAELDYTDLLEKGAVPERDGLPAVTTFPVDDSTRSAYLLRIQELRSRFRKVRSPVDADQVAKLLSDAVRWKLPSSIVAVLESQGVDPDAVRLITTAMGDVARYASEPAYRASIVHRALQDMPRGEVILIGHSLGSVVAADVLAYLPEDVHVRLLMTLGSPLSYQLLRDIGLAGVSPPLPFPYERVHRWINVVDPRDFVTGFSGLEVWWSEVADAAVSNPLARLHDIGAYLAHAEVGKAVGEALGGDQLPAFPDRSPVPRDPLRVQRDTTEQQAVALHFARCVSEAEDDADARKRARLAVDEILGIASEALGQRLGRDKCEQITGSWGMRSPRLHRILAVNELALGDPFAPFAPGVSSTAERRALKRVAADLSLQPEIGSDVCDLIASAQKLFKQKAGLSKKVLVGVGLAALAAVAAPAAVGAFAAAGASGAAALTSGLAAIGGGGMAGGLGALGAAGVGGGFAVAQLARDGTSEEGVMLSLVAILVRIRSVRRWGEPGDVVKAAEATSLLPSLIDDYSNQLDFHEGLSAPDSAAVKSLKANIDRTKKAIKYLDDRQERDSEFRLEKVGLGPALEPGDAGHP